MSIVREKDGSAFFYPEGNDDEDEHGSPIAIQSNHMSVIPSREKEYMDMMNMMNMMGGFGIFWMIIGTLLFIVLATVVVWFLVRWLNRQKAPMMPYIPQQDSYRTYERGYEPPAERPETSQEGSRPYNYPHPKDEYEQSQVQYPQEQEMPPQR